MQPRKVLALLKRPFGRNSILSISGQLHMPISCSRSAGSFCAVCSDQGFSYVCGATQVQPSESPSLFPSLKQLACAIRCLPLLCRVGEGLASSSVAFFDANSRFSAFGTFQLSGCESQAKAQQKRTPQSRQGGTNPRLNPHHILLTWWQARGSASLGTQFS